MKVMPFSLTDGTSWNFNIKRVVNGGFSGRNQEAVWAHIEELEKIGVKRPEKTPTFYPVPSNSLLFDDDIQVVGKENSTEIEYVLLYSSQGLFVALGCDHTDRELEVISIPKSKLAYPNIISREVWDYEEIKEHWDQIQIRCWLGEGRKTLYQEGTLASIMPPEELLDYVQKLISEDLEGTVLFSGTLASLTEGIAFSRLIEGEMYDPVLNRRLSLKYGVEPITWFKE